MVLNPASSSRIRRGSPVSSGKAESADLLACLRRAWDGHGQIVLISGEPASPVCPPGSPRKSQRRRTGGYATSARPITATASLYPFVQQFDRAAGIALQEAPEETVLGLATDRTGEVAPLIASMLSIPPSARYPNRSCQAGSFESAG